jgi:hypothetical protein
MIWIISALIIGIFAGMIIGYNIKKHEKRLYSWAILKALSGGHA